MKRAPKFKIGESPSLTITASAYQNPLEALAEHYREVHGLPDCGWVIFRDGLPVGVSMDLGIPSAFELGCLAVSSDGAKMVLFDFRRGPGWTTALFGDVLRHRRLAKVRAVELGLPEYDQVRPES